MSLTNILDSSNKQFSKSRKISRKISISVQQISEKTMIQIVQEPKKQLDNMIDQLDEKIKKRIQASYGNFLHAYQIHLQKITKELKTLKQTNDIYEKKHSNDQAITHLARQCSLFRQQAMRLHNQLEDSLVQADIYKRKSEIQEGEIRKINQTLKKYIALNKCLQNENKKLKMITQNNDKQLLQLKNIQPEAQKQNQNVHKELQFINQKGLCKQHSKTKRTLKSDLRIKIPQTQRSKSHNLKVSDILNSSLDSFLLSSPKPGCTSPHYAVFSNEKIDNKIQQSPKNKSLKPGSRVRNKTHSTLQYRNNSHRQINISSFDENLTKTENYQTNFEVIGMNQQIRNQLEYFKILMDCLEKARRVSLSFNDQDYKLKSKNISQLIFDDQDMRKFCEKIFPNLDINQQLTDFGTKFKAKAKQRCKTLAHLSAELMKKIKVKGSEQKKKQFRIDNSQMHCFDSETINKKSKIGTQIKQVTYKLNQQLTAKQNKNIKKMNQTFKRKTIKNKSMLSSFYAPLQSNLKESVMK